MIGKALILILIGVTLRMLGAATKYPFKFYNIKERIFMAVAWIPKAVLIIYHKIIYVKIIIQTV